MTKLNLIVKIQLYLYTFLFCFSNGLVGVNQLIFQHKLCDTININYKHHVSCFRSYIYETVQCCEFLLQKTKIKSLYKGR